MRTILLTIAKNLIPLSLRRGISRAIQWPPVGKVRMGYLRRLEPLSRNWGYERGLPIDRYYIEQYLSAYAGDIQGRVLEIKDDTYTTKYGGARVTESAVLHKEPGNPRATIVADLTEPESLAEDHFDCIICTQTLQFIYNVRAAVLTLRRILRPGGVLLVTVPGIARISRYDMERWGDYWRFTTASARLLFEEAFQPGMITVSAWGNVVTATAFLHGFASGELKQDELDYVDPDYELLIAIRAVKTENDG